MKYTSSEIQPVDAVATETSVDVDASLRAYSPLQMHFLARLRRLDDVRKELRTTPDPDPFTKKLVEHGVFATYRECMDEGIGAEARHILKI